MNIDKNDIRLLVTGGSGFIGTNVIEAYKKAGSTIRNIDIADPILVDHREYWENVNILDFAAVERVFKDFKPTHVLHLAARTDLEETSNIDGYDDNIKGAQNIIDAIKSVDSVERVIITSTMFVNEPGTSPKNDFDYNPHSVYGQSKVITEKITIEAGLDCIWSIARPAVIWGPFHERLRNGFFSIVGRGLYFHPGRGVARKSYGYVGNSVYQIEQIFNSSRDDVDKKVFYLADPPIKLEEWTNGFSQSMLGKSARRMPYSLMKLLALIGDVAVKLGNPDFPMTTFRLNNMTRDNIVNTTSINKIAPTLPYSMTDGIAQTVAWLNSVND
jgi:nucleoside-diphosphate-sugar epimerase